MKKWYVFLFLILFVVTAGFTLVSQDFSDVQIKTTHIAGNIHMLEGQGGNIAVSVGEDGVVMVDDQFAPLADKIRTAIAELGGETPKFILNTHWHPDHTDGNVKFAEDGTIVAHDNVRKRLMVKSYTAISPEGSGPAPEEAWPVITFDKSLSIHMNGEEIKVLHYPNGHTDGDAVIYFTGSNVVHMGDDFFAGIFPFVDLINGGSVQGLTENVGKIIDELPPDVKIIPGHGPLSSIEDLKDYHRMLQETTQIVQGHMEKGKNLADIQATGLPDEYEQLGKGFIKTDFWIETIYKSLSEKTTQK
ncbi:MBL fold metallo-hydrolase [candidate division KSB1 bacterium]|nr:MBL fold metallo-hydrolase [candidate division KSB1 bacterium]NIR69688.1 MBL fold metallo-hydrolase [candidate division KSB1 bacterium]NIS24338.1 MBL fold metallo-hydrolase [candidate division KSB1 bacterium]NIT71266.1 MBL fold metallo-hydrolase [candidate division KSB1 bacterium]NIU24972.1 MBL fold metallo-hydrolase [candidate division KSB1 bacterium]